MQLPLGPPLKGWAIVSSPSGRHPARSDKQAPRSSRVVACLALVCLAGVARGAPQERLGLRWVPDVSKTNQTVVEVSGLDAETLRALRGASWTAAQWRSLLTVRVEHGDLFKDVGIPSMLGDYRVLDRAVRFEPRFPLEPGVRYRAELHPDKLPGAPSGALRSNTAGTRSTRTTPTQRIGQTLSAPKDYRLCRRHRFRDSLLSLRAPIR